MSQINHEKKNDGRQLRTHPFVIGLVGPMRSGKDSACLAFKKAFGDERVKRMSFGDPLKREIMEATGIRVSEQEADRPRWRALWQWWGTEFRRELFGEDYWVKKMKEHLRRTEAEVVVLTDVRFPNEAQMVRELGGKLFRLYRPVRWRDRLAWVYWKNRFSAGRHASETLQRSIAVDDVLRNAGSLADLEAEAAQLAVEHGIFTTHDIRETTVPASESLQELWQRNGV